jgi:nicotinate-nucleotide pyrophosphorylase (carboxylating)
MLSDAQIDPAELGRSIEVALFEDLRFGPDVTSDATIPDDHFAEAAVVARQPGIVCGVPVALAVLDAVGFRESGVTVVRHDGDTVGVNDVVLQVSGALRPLLLAERTLLNFMTHLSGVATATNAWVRALEGTACKVRDTRKTTPGLRQLEKCAVRSGGGTNHRMGLGDAALIKDNHIAAAGGITRAVAAIRASDPDIDLEVECDTLAQVSEAVEAGCTLILLDNMDLEEIKAAVETIRRVPGVRCEASGGMTLDNAGAIARTGVDYIAVGSLTHSAIALDLGLDIVTTG